MTPHTFTLRHGPAHDLRSGMARAGLLLSAAAMRLSLKLLTRDHPSRVFAEGRLAESVPALTDSLLTCRTCAYVGESVVGASTLAILWVWVDQFIPYEVGPLDLIALALPGF